MLRASAGRDPYDRALSDLVGELSTQSDQFRTRWAQHNVRQHISGIKHFTATHEQPDTDTAPVSDTA